MARMAYRHYRLEFSKNSSGNNEYYTVNELGLYGSIAPGSPNLCIGAVTTASGQYSTQAPGYATDGNPTTFWESGLNGSPSWLQVDLGSPVAIFAFSLLSTKYADERPVDFKIKASADGIAWTEMDSRTAFAAHAGEVNLIGFGVKGISTLEDGSPSSKVAVFRWSDQSLVATVTPGHDGSWKTLVAEPVLVTHMGPSGFRPLSDGPITPGDLLA